MSMKKYYGKSGEYLSEHKDYFSEEQLQADVVFLMKFLQLKKHDKILDLACGNGRHTIALAKRGFEIDGLDFSTYLLKIAKAEAQENKLHAKFFCQDIHKLNLKNKYNKIFLFFSEFGLFDGQKVLEKVYKTLEKDGLFLLDYDNVFRLVKRMQELKDFEYDFDFVKMQLVGKKKGDKVSYYTPKDLKIMFEKAGFKVIKIFGDYDGSSITANSKRIILVGKK